MGRIEELIETCVVCCLGMEMVETTCTKQQEMNTFKLVTSWINVSNSNGKDLKADRDKRCVCFTWCLLRVCRWLSNWIWILLISCHETLFLMQMWCADRDWFGWWLFQVLISLRLWSNRNWILWEQIWWNKLFNVGCASIRLKNSNLRQRQSKWSELAIKMDQITKQVDIRTSA